VPDGHIEELESQFVRGKMIARLRTLWSDRRFILRCAMAGLLAGVAAAFLIPKSYESTAQLMPPDTQSSSNLALLAGLSGPGGLGMMAGDLLGMKSTGALFVGVLRSRTVEDRIIDQFDLKKVYGTSLEMTARRKLEERTALSEDRKSGIITLTVTDHDAKRAAAIARAYVDSLDTLMAKLSTSSARRERIFLEERLGAVQLELDAAEKDFSQFASSKGAIDIPAQGKAMVEAGAALEGQLIAAQSELEGLKQIYTNNNVRVRSTQARVDELRQQLRRLGGKAESIPQKDGGTSSDASYPTLRQLPILGVPFADKLRRLKVEEAVFETLTKQYELAKVEEAKEVPSVKVLDAPLVPEYKSFPPRMLIIFTMTLCAAVGGVLWVMAKVRWSEMDPLDPGKALAEEVLQTVAARFPLVSRNGHSSVPAETNGEQKKEDFSRAKGAGTGD
jgi:uncharacterized protein involved in exopolysaccharide biosynthesis